MEDEGLSPYARERYSDLAKEWARLRSEYRQTGKHEGAAWYLGPVFGLGGLSMALFGPFDGGDYFLNAFTSGVLITISIASFLYIWTDRSKSGKLFLAMFKIEEELGDKGYEPRDDGTFRKKSH